MKIKSILFLFFNVLFIAYGHCNKASAAICDGDVTLSSQAEVDAFQCTEVTGVLKISGTDIVNLDALSTLTRVGALFCRTIRI